MATLAQLEQALIRADAAGDMDAARMLAAAIKEARQDPVNQIPDMVVPGTQAVKADPSLAQRALGAGETALTLATGATTGTLGAIGGTIKGVGQSIVDGTIGTQQGVRTAQQSAQEGAQALTYAPRTQAGQEMVQATGKFLSETVPPVIPQVAAPGMLTESIRMAAPIAQATVRSAAAPVAAAVRRASDVVDDGLNNIGQQVRTATGPGKASISAAQVEIGKLRQAKADELPVPIKQTLGQRTRDYAQQQFERETAKNLELGAPIRERFQEQQKQMLQNLDTFVDMTGAEATDLRDVGIRVNDTLRSMVASAKNKERALYKAAEKAGELQAKVKTDSLVTFLDENNSLNTPELSGASLGLVERELVRLKGATRGPDGKLVAGELSLGDMELVRKQLNKAINAKLDNRTNMMTGSQAKEVIDSITEGVGGEMYKRARLARAQRARDFENVTLVSNLLGTKKGTTDRTIALENVANQSIISQSTPFDQTRHLGMLLKKTPQGQQAWRELQGATLRHIRDEAFKGVTTDAAGNRVVSPATLNRAITNLDKSGKLDYVFGKKGAEQLRILNEVAQETFTAPPGAVNSSNTSSALLNAIDTMTTFTATGLPVPAMATIKGIREQMKNRAIRQRVNEALQ